MKGRLSPWDRPARLTTAQAICTGACGATRSGNTHPMPKAWKAVRYCIDALLILVPLLGSLYFLFEPDAFNAALAWLLPFH